VPTTRTASLLLVFALIAAACSGDDDTTIEASPTSTETTPPRLAPTDHLDPAADCRSAFGEGPTTCGPGADITSVRVDSSGPIVLTVELSETPHYDVDFQWLIEFLISDLACGLTNTSSPDGSFVGSEVLGPYGYRTLTNENAPPGTCDGSLDGTTATIIFNVQPPLGPWTIDGGTQYVETANLDDAGSSDDVVIEMTDG
jgi:hypothetical protein